MLIFKFRLIIFESIFQFSASLYTCIHAKVRSLKGIPALVQLYSSENQEVQRYATGATRNLIYENMENKTALIEAGGISKLVSALKEPDDELRKNVTGIMLYAAKNYILESENISNMDKFVSLF